MQNGREVELESALFGERVVAISASPEGGFDGRY